LTYPKISLRVAKRRLRQLQKLDVKRIFFEGRTRLGRLGLLGVGTVSLVVKAETSDGICALKIRRTDANRESMTAEFQLTRLANRIGVGAAVMRHSNDFIIMQHLNGVEIEVWLKSLAGSHKRDRARDVVHRLLNQCRKLDILGLDHGQLSNLRKHVIILENLPYVIDFESASLVRKSKNVTTAAQYLFVGGKISALVRRTLGVKEQSQVIEALKAYKREMNDYTYDKFLTKIHLAS
jgi:putative serine/threonine protein kinase